MSNSWGTSLSTSGIAVGEFVVVFFFFFFPSHLFIQKGTSPIDGAMD